MAPPSTFGGRTRSLWGAVTALSPTGDPYGGWVGIGDVSISHWEWLQQGDPYPAGTDAGQRA